MIPYDKTKKDCVYGSFDTDIPAGYTITAGEKLRGPWYYIYNNRKLLLYVDQNGPVKMQYQPPNGILIFKREMGENQSKWQVWVQSADLNEGVPVSNFNSPRLRYDLKKPEFTVQWMPEKAVYTSKYDTADIITELFMPTDKSTVCMKTTIINKSEKTMDFTVTPTVFPYVNIPQMVAWDLPEWYLATSVKHYGEMLTLHGKMTDPKMVKASERSVTYNIDFDEDAEYVLDMASFCGSGNFFSPDSVKYNLPLGAKMADADGVSFSGHQAVWAARYAFSLDAGAQKTFTQVLTVQEGVEYCEEQNLFEKIYFDAQGYQDRYEQTSAYYTELFAKRRIRTSNPLYDNFINAFTPLQMSWVCSLDRGWPSSMRGIRDASQDFMGMTVLDPAWTRQTLIEMLEHQQTDGWMPRQISTVSRTAPHDMRYYCDGGAFLLELVHEYMTFTRDKSLLDEKVVWLDSDEASTILEHIQRCVEFYIADKNIGEHGLCKVWNGDWWDPMDKIGLDGRGESVTVTAQMILVLQNLADMYAWLCDTGNEDASLRVLATLYLEKREKFMEAMRTHAYNASGYFNGYFNDNGKWLMSDNDPDGNKRLYLVSNSWALIAGCADEQMRASVIENIEKMSFGTRGYNTSSLGFSVPVEKAGRIGLGSRPNPYNHAQSFFVRACCAIGDAERAYKATRYILPIEEAYTPVEQSFAPPFSIANCYSNSEKTMHRVCFQYLSGTVSYVLRTVYNFFFGIHYGYDGLTLRPCIPSAFGNCSVEFSYLGKKIVVEYVQTEQQNKTVTFNGRVWETKTDKISNKPTAFFADADLADENKIIFEY